MLEQQHAQQQQQLHQQRFQHGQVVTLQLPPQHRGPAQYEELRDSVSTYTLHILHR
jgi:hypothetical protein